MKIIYSPVHKKHAPRCEVYDGEESPYPEVPERIEMIRKGLLKNKLGEVMSPHSFPTKYIDAIHLSNYREFLSEKSKMLKKNSNFFASYFIMDTYAPLTQGTYLAAKEAVDVALTGAEYMRKGDKLVYALSRPPGHHAGYVNMGGYCYFNNAAIAAHFLSQFGKVAILDIDYHHGNGTQQAFYSRDDVLYVSLHADPHKKFPYISGFADEVGVEKGKGYTKNYPLPITTTEQKYLTTLEKTLTDIHAYDPKFLVLSAGFDTYKEDPTGGLGLSKDSYYTIGTRIASLSLPTLVVQEGGYNVEALGDIASHLIKGLQLQEV